MASNHRPQRYKRYALTPELQAHDKRKYNRQPLIFQGFVAILSFIINFMNETTQKIIVSVEDAGKCLDVYLAQVFLMSRTQAASLVEEGRVHFGARQIKKPAERVKEGLEITIHTTSETGASVPELEVPTLDKFPQIEILKETEDYIVFNKPAGLLVHETEAREPITLAAWLVQKYPHIKEVGENPQRPGIVHRLDKDASGVLIVAKTQAMFDALKEQFKNRTIEKEYQVLVQGVVAADEGKIDFAIDRGSDGRMVARPKTDPLKLESVGQMQDGKDALTTFVVMKRFINYTLLSVRIHTGRTHQIRVHMYAYNHPVVGDTIYFQKKLEKFNKGIGRLFLHAYRLKFQNLQGEKVEVMAPLPEKLEEFLKKVK